MNDLDVIYEVANTTFHRECAMASACILFNPDGSINYHPTSKQIFDLFEYNFKRFYLRNHAPFPLYLSEEWIHDEHRREGLFAFIKDKLNSTREDIYFVSISEVIDWMKNPVTLEEYRKNSKCKPIVKTECQLNETIIIDNDTQFKRSCEFTNITELDGLTKRMVICDNLQCPTHYPWVNRLE